MAILRTTEVIRLTGLSRTTLWRFERSGRFPARLRLGTNCVGWLEDEVLGWIQSRPSGLANNPLLHAPGSVPTARPER
jgi:predicted DNA-binding transcriptional regulator AlpA